jgi:hypothetical protein
MIDGIKLAFTDNDLRTPGRASAYWFRPGIVLGSGLFVGTGAHSPDAKTDGELHKPSCRKSDDQADAVLGVRTARMVSCHMPSIDTEHRTIKSAERGHPFQALFLDHASGQKRPITAVQELNMRAPKRTLTASGR